MAEITIEGKKFELDNLSEGAKQQLVMIQAVDAEIQRLQVLSAIAQTARVAYFTALNEQLPTEDKPEA